MSYMRPRRASLGSNQSMPSKFGLVRRSMGDTIDYAVRVTGSHPFAQSGSIPMGSDQSKPSNYGRIARAMGSMPDTRALMTPAGSAQRYGFGSLGDDTDQAPATVLEQPTLSTPTIVDPWSSWRDQMLTQTTTIAAAQQDFTRRESMQRWVQIGATLLIPLSAAIWRAIFRSGRSSARDFE